MGNQSSAKERAAIFKLIIEFTRDNIEKIKENRSKKILKNSWKASIDENFQSTDGNSRIFSKKRRIMKSLTRNK